jgi:S1-C subfamily serine protease
MKKILLLICAFFCFQPSMLAQNAENFYFGSEGEKTAPAVATYYIKSLGNNVYEGFYLNDKLYFKGKITKLDFNKFNNSTFSDTCKWYFKNGKEKFIYLYNQEGKLNGTSRSYYESGNVWKEYEYVNNNLELNKYIENLEDGQRFEIYEEPFKNNDADWDLINNAQHEAKIENGFLWLNAKTGEGTSRFKYIKFEKDDFILHTKFETIKAKSSQEAGLIFGFKDWNNYNFFLISKENYSIGTVYEGAKNIEVKDMFSSSIQSNEMNELKIISNGGDLVYIINGKVVYKTTKPTFFGNNIGVVSLGKFVMKIDEIVFKQVSYSSMGSGKNAGNKNNQEVKATGTGFFISNKGHVATNFHVIENGKNIIVDVLDETNSTYRSYKATILIKDVENDLTILKISDESYKSAFPEMEYAISTTNSYEMGSAAYTLGFPLALSGMGTDVKFTDGKISAKTGYEGAMNSFQTTIPVQPGNSGGPVFNAKGELIGVINSKISKADNVSYGIKNSMLTNIIQSAPEDISLPNGSNSTDVNLEDKVKKLKKYVVMIRVK